MPADRSIKSNAFWLNLSGNVDGNFAADVVATGSAFFLLVRPLME
jgi:hypothetical protein